MERLQPLLLFLLPHYVSLSALSRSLGWHRTTAWAVLRGRIERLHPDRARPLVEAVQALRPMGTYGRRDPFATFEVTPVPRMSNERERLVDDRETEAEQHRMRRRGLLKDIRGWWVPADKVRGKAS